MVAQKAPPPKKKEKKNYFYYNTVAGTSRSFYSSVQPISVTLDLIFTPSMKFN